MVAAIVVDQHITFDHAFSMKWQGVPTQIFRVSNVSRRPNRDGTETLISARECRSSLDMCGARSGGERLCSGAEGLGVSESLCSRSTFMITDAEGLAKASLQYCTSLET